MKKYTGKEAPRRSILTMSEMKSRRTTVQDWGREGEKENRKENLTSLTCTALKGSPSPRKEIFPHR